MRSKERPWTIVCRRPHSSVGVASVSIDQCCVCPQRAFPLAPHPTFSTWYQRPCYVPRAQANERPSVYASTPTIVLLSFCTSEVSSPFSFSITVCLETSSFSSLICKRFRKYDRCTVTVGQPSVCFIEGAFFSFSFLVLDMTCTLVSPLPVSKEQLPCAKKL